MEQRERADLREATGSAARRKPGPRAAVGGEQCPAQDARVALNTGRTCADSAANCARDRGCGRGGS